MSNITPYMSNVTPYMSNVTHSYNSSNISPNRAQRRRISREMQKNSKNLSPKNHPMFRSSDTQLPRNLRSRVALRHNRLVAGKKSYYDIFKDYIPGSMGGSDTTHDKIVRRIKREQSVLQAVSGLNYEEQYYKQLEGQLVDFSNRLEDLQAQLESANSGRLKAEEALEKAKKGSSMELKGLQAQLESANSDKLKAEEALEKVWKDHSMELKGLQAQLESANSDKLKAEEALEKAKKDHSMELKGLQAQLESANSAKLKAEEALEKARNDRRRIISCPYKTEVKILQAQLESANSAKLKAEKALEKAKKDHSMELKGLQARLESANSGKLKAESALENVKKKHSTTVKDLISVIERTCQKGAIPPEDRIPCRYMKKYITDPKKLLEALGFLCSRKIIVDNSGNLEHLCSLLQRIKV